MSGFVFHPEALADLHEIFDFIAADSPKSAQDVVEEIYETIRTLTRFPNAGHVRKDLTANPIRFHPVRNYVIAYAPDETPLLVLAVLHARRNPRIVAAFLRSRQ